MRAAFLTIIALGILAGSVLAGDGGLEIERLRITGRGNVRIVARFDPADVPRDFDPWTDTATVRIDGQPVAEFDHWSATHHLPGFRYLERTKEPTPRRVWFDLGEGRLVIRAKRVPRPVVGFSEVVVSLRLGDRTLTACVKTETKGSRTRYRGEPAPKPGADLAFETLAGNILADSDACGVTVARDADALAELCADLRHEPPTVDFETDMVALLRLGYRPSSGYSVEPLRVKECGEGAHIVLREIRPGGRCLTMAMVTSPWVMVRLPRRDGPVTAGVKARTIRCR